MDPIVSNALLLTGNANTTIVVDSNKDGIADYELKEKHKNGKQIITKTDLKEGTITQVDTNYRLGKKEHIQSISIYDNNNKFVKNGTWTTDGYFLGGIDDKSEPGKHSLKKINPNNHKDINIFGD